MKHEVREVVRSPVDQLRHASILALKPDLRLLTNTAVTHANHGRMCRTNAPLVYRVCVVLGTSIKRAVTLQVIRDHIHLCGWSTFDFNNRRCKQSSLPREAGMPFNRLLRLPSYCKLGIRKRSSALSLIVITRRAVRVHVAALYGFVYVNYVARRRPPM